jgi:hypothetical protein
MATKESLRAQLAAEKARRVEAEERLARARAVLNKPTAPNGFYRSGFATQYEVLAEMFNEELPAALHAALEEPL